MKNYEVTIESKKGDRFKYNISLIVAADNATQAKDFAVEIAMADETIDKGTRAWLSYKGHRKITASVTE